MVTMAQRIGQLRTARNLTRPALSAALGLPRTAAEKFETGRQTPSQEQQNKLAAYFGVSVFYLRGETNDPTRMDSWIDGAFLGARPADESAAEKPPVKPAAAPSGSQQGTVLDAFLSGKQFQQALRAAVLDVLRTPEGQKILAKAIRGGLPQK